MTYLDHTSTSPTKATRGLLHSLENDLSVEKTRLIQALKRELNAMTSLDFVDAHLDVKRLEKAIEETQQRIYVVEDWLIDHE